MKPFLVVFAVIATSFFYFPFEFTFLPAINTKLMLAGVGLLIMGYHTLKMERMYLSKELAIASLIAIIFSCVALYAVEYNRTSDYAYTAYILSMWIWLAAAYTICMALVCIHGYISFRLITNYLVAVCVLQCILALVIDFAPTVKNFVDAYITIGITDFLNRVERLYGIGAALDVAGLRFSVVLIMISVLLCVDDEVQKNKFLITTYTMSFFIIAILGNMMARSTSVGMLIAFIYLIYGTGLLKLVIKFSSINLWKILLICVIFSSIIVIYFYNTNKEVQILLRFAFEGFFKWIETGKWETDSTEKLQTMWIYPETLKTWVIGDGYFDDPNRPGYFYMGTDVGYLRFIFYCGLIGLTIFSSFFIYLSYALWHRFANIKPLFFLLFILVFINWLKVSTDIFLVYALFLCLGSPYIRTLYYKN